MIEASGEVRAVEGSEVVSATGGRGEVRVVGDRGEVLAVEGNGTVLAVGGSGEVRAEDREVLEEEVKIGRRGPDGEDSPGRLADGQGESKRRSKQI